MGYEVIGCFGAAQQGLWLAQVLLPDSVCKRLTFFTDKKGHSNQPFYCKKLTGLSSDTAPPSLQGHAAFCKGQPVGRWILERRQWGKEQRGSRLSLRFGGKGLFKQQAKADGDLWRQSSPGCLLRAESARAVCLEPDSVPLAVSSAEASPKLEALKPEVGHRTFYAKLMLRGSELWGMILWKDYFNEALCIPTSHTLFFFLPPDIILHHLCHMEERNDAVLICCHKNMKCCLCDLQSRLELGISTLKGFSTCWNSFSFQSRQVTVLSSFPTNEKSCHKWICKMCKCFINLYKQCFKARC